MARARASSTRLAVAAALALAAAAAAGAQSFRQPPTSSVPSAAAAPTDPAARPAAGDPAGVAQPTTGAPALRGAGGDLPPAAATPTDPASGVPASRAQPPVGPATLPALIGLQGGGDPAPACRSACAGALYRCADAGGDDACQATARTCRSDCDITSQPVGRLVSPLPQSGLAAAGALRALPGSLSAPPPRQ